jgi:hypothetical protein
MGKQRSMARASDAVVMAGGGDLVGAMMALPRRPVNRDHANEDEGKSDFGFDIGKPIGNPPGSDVVPINERWMASNEISVNPDGHAY